jgi:hypothetical protein
METLENKPYTFWELLNKVGIKIPIIQRDYAQGRNTNNVKRIRENFLNTLYKTLEEEEKQLDLDFVYGSVKDNYLIPLDGQQRLTTLFLLHYFLALKENKLNDSIKKTLKKFTYETRISSREFIKQLIEKNINLDERRISEIIKDQTWFFSEWENDPTITSMLNMLDSIQEKFKNTENFFEKLINKKIITFSFLNLKEFKLTDELYVKMNARGKPLTEFENFKSKFEECINKADELEKKEKIKAKLDNKWLDFFWNKTIEDLKEKKQSNNYSLSSETDKKFYNFFYNITFIFYLETLKNEEELKLNNKEFSTIKEFIDNISIFDFYQEVYKNPQKIKEIEKILDNLKEIEKKLTDKNEKEIFKRIISTKNIGQNEIAKFYSVVLGIIYELNSQEFNRWLRVTFNLINNQLIQSPKDLIKAIQVLRNLIIKSNKDIYNYIDKSPENIEYFSEIQRKEESLKAPLIKDLSCEDEFIKAENNWYLKGQIGFLINFATKNNNFNLNEFKKYRDKFSILWDFVKEKNKENHILLYQSLLTKGNYLPKTGSNHTFCSFNTSIRERSENWQKVFNSEKKEYIKKLLDDINENDIKHSLIQIKNNWLKNKSYNNFDFEGNFENIFIFTLVSNKKNIIYCENLQIRYYENGKEVYLLKKYQMNGNHAELYTYNFYTKIDYFKNNNWKYHKTDSWGENPCIYNTFKLDNENDEFKINILWNNKKGKFFIEILNEKEKNIENIYEKLKNYFEKKNKGTYGYPVLKSIRQFKLDEENELIEFIEHIVNPEKTSPSD